MPLSPSQVSSVPTSSANRTQVWLARSAFALLAASAATLPLFAGGRSLAMVMVGLAAVATFVAAAYWFLARRGVLRVVAGAALILVPLVVLVVYLQAGLLWVSVLALVLLLLAASAAATALTVDDAGMRTYDAAPVNSPFLVMNPYSGGGKVARFGLKGKAEAMGAEVVMLEGPGTVDVAALTRDAVARGADLLGVAGGDGTQAIVAGIAAEHDLPFLVISAGTRNHFALDLGLDRADPASCLAGLTDDVELRVDLGVIGGRTFVNNASFGAYAQIVQSPAYRADKTRTGLDLMPDLLAGHRGPRLAVELDDVTVQAPQAVLISNDPYGSTDPVGLGRRTRLDRGVLGLVVIRVQSARQAIGLLRRNRGHGLTRFTASEVVIQADAAEIPVGIDGEAIMMPTPVRCASWPQALRVRVPRERPGIRSEKPVLDWVQLRHLAFGRRSPVPRPRSEIEARTRTTSS